MSSSNPVTSKKKGVELRTREDRLAEQYEEETFVYTPYPKPKTEIGWIQHLNRQRKRIHEEADYQKCPRLHHVARETERAYQSLKKFYEERQRLPPEYRRSSRSGGLCESRESRRRRRKRKNDEARETRSDAPTNPGHEPAAARDGLEGLTKADSTRHGQI